MYNFNILIEKQWKFYVAHNLQLDIVSQWLSYEEALINIKEASILYMEEEDKSLLFNKFEDKTYSLTNMAI